MNPIDVSSQLPQLQPPPSGDSNMPVAGMVLNQQSGRSRGQPLTLPVSLSADTCSGVIATSANPAIRRAGSGSAPEPQFFSAAVLGQLGAGNW